MPVHNERKRIYLKIVTKCWSNQSNYTANKKNNRHAIFQKLYKQIDINLMFDVKVKNVGVGFQKIKL